VRYIHKWFKTFNGELVCITLLRIVVEEGILPTCKGGVLMAQQ